MKTRVIEATREGLYLKAIIGKFDHEEWDRKRALPGYGYSRLLSKWTDRHFWILDLELGTGAMFLMGSSPRYGLAKARADF